MATVTKKQPPIKTKPPINIQIDNIQIPSTARAVSAHLDVLIESIKHVGLLHPVTVRKVGESYELLSGHNRIQAIKNLGWKEISAKVLDYADANDLRQQLSVADENLCRDNLTDLEFAEALGRAKAIYEALYPETKHNGSKKKNPPSHPKNGSEPLKRPAFLDDTSRKLGRSRSSLGNYIYIYTHLREEARDCIRHHEIADRYSDLYALAQETTDQFELAKILRENATYRLADAHT